MSITYTVSVDRDDDGLFTGVDENISADVLDLRWQLGLSHAYDSVAPSAVAEVLLDNRDGAYSPESSALTVGKRLQISSFDGTTTRTHFVGFITHFVPSAGNRGERLAHIFAQDVLAQVSASRVSVPPQLNQTAESILTNLLQRVPLRRSILKGRWLLGRVTHGELGTNTRFTRAVTPQLQTGKTVFAYVGDTWADGIRAVDAIREIVEAERGRFYGNRQGEVVFLNRHHLLKNDSVQATLSDSFEALEYTFGEDLLSHMRVECLPRTLGTPQTVLWQAPSAIACAPYHTQRFRVQWRDALDQAIGAIDVQTPTRTLDWQVNSASNGSGTDLTTQTEWTLVQVDFRGATLEIRNPTAQTVYVLAGAKIYGTPLHLESAVTVEHVDSGTANIYGVHARTLRLSALNSVSQADAVARFELARHKTPRGHVKTITLNAFQHPNTVLACTVFDRVQVVVGQVAHSADYFIVAEAHHVSNGGAVHRVTWTLEPADANRFWVVGKRRLRTDSVVAY